MKKHSVIIDCDTGTDDAVAIIAALGSEELDIRAITTVCGNVDLAYTAANTLNLVRMLGFDTPVARGAERPLLRDITQLRASDKEAPGGFGTHGQTGMGNVRLLESSDSFYEKNAVETIYEQAVQCKGELEIIALGPQTNLALALNVYPELKRMIKCIYFMGGAVEGGNSSAVAEFNIFFDPEAAKIVFGSGIPLVMVGLDVTRKIVLTPDILEYMCCVNPQMGERIRNITRFYFDFHWKQEGIIGCVINDPLAVAYFIDRTLCSGMEACTRIATEGLCIGQSVVDRFDFWKGHKNSYILTRTSPLSFMQMFFDRVLGVPDKTSLPMLEQIMKGDVL